MPGWDDPQYELEEFDGGGAPFAGYPSSADFQEGSTTGGTPLGPQLVMNIERSHPEDTPNAKPTIRWTWTVSGNKQRENWTIQGSKVVHAEGKHLNASTDLGKLFKSVKEHLPPIEGFDPLDAKSWAGLDQFKDSIQWGWVQEPKRMQTADGKWVDDLDAKPKSTLVIAGFIGASNGHKPEFDLASLGADPTQLDILRQAATASKNVGEFQAAIIQPLAGQPVLGTVMKQPGDVYASLLVS